jgi:hypothetical protein
MNWRNVLISEDATHHVINGVPAYDLRFDEVLKFHEPGLAPVQNAHLAWHIDANGRAAYQRHFRRTFGFYEGFAAVISANGWHHIRPDGVDLTSTRYEWCGNFQEGRCAVRQVGGSYHHILSNGLRFYDQCWRYAGDFKDGIAVVQRNDGQSTHIDRAGNLIHENWFLDLDVFHKGYARAKFASGWAHIDRLGRAIYLRRFAAIEPFYNSQARVERFDGGLEVINEEGVCVVELRSAIQTEFSRLSTDLVGFWKTKTISSAVELKIFESLPAEVEKIALDCGLKLDLIKRLLRALGELNLLEYSRGVWSVTAKGAYLKQAHPMTLADAAIEYGQYLSPMWNGLSDAIRGNDKWHAPDIFNQVALDSERTLPHHRMLQSYALHDYAHLPEVLNLDSITHLIDAGGGTGSVTKFLVKRYESLKISLFDLPEVIDQARNLIGVHEQIDFHGGDLFRAWGLHADAVLLARVLHDWDDQAAFAILQRARSTLSIGGRIFIVEMLLLEDEMSGGLCDLHLLMATGGRERTLSGYRLLLESTGFDFHESVKLSSLLTVLVGVAK